VFRSAGRARQRCLRCSRTLRKDASIGDDLVIKNGTVTDLVIRNLDAQFTDRPALTSIA
jgi:hypothetical protein